ncbi:hypothetical protein [Devosia sp.]|uniref:hypothetical protein n=1 Tax=Devosia sp. TaxID=1871048 RepID=UPI0035AF3B85
MSRRMVVQQAVSDEGQPELILYYEDKEVLFDEPHLFAFGETLARQDRFRADAATAWGDGYDWSEVRDLLENLVEAGILELGAPEIEVPTSGHARTSLLPPARATIARSWADCAAITDELAGRAVDPAHLELIVPMFRVAHIALDADGRQVGEANVFPRPLRLDTPTEWKACPFPGTRYMADRPMNASALKAMRNHWPQMMAALKFIRAHFLRRFPAAADGWTLAHVERLAALVLAVPTYQLVRAGAEAAPLHPALSSLFRVTDGLRMATHQMMFIPVGEPVLPPDTPITAEAIFDYAERNYSFHSETGVCAGPSHMVREFLDVVLHGEEDEDFAFDPEVATALDAIDAAFEYGLNALRAHTALFRFWPAMARSYERLAEIAGAAVARGETRYVDLATRLSAHVSNMQRVTLLGTEERRSDRDRAYAEIFDQCGLGLRAAGVGLLAQLASARTRSNALADHLAKTLTARLGHSHHTTAFAAAVAEFALETQAIIAVSERCQAAVNTSIGRATPRRAFSAADIAVHGRLLGNVPQRLPFLTEEVAEALGINLSIDANGIAVTAFSDFPSSADIR